MVKFNGVPIVAGVFPNNERYYSPLRDTFSKEKTQIITVIFEGNQDLFDALIYKKYLDNLGYTKVVLNIPFMPYGQMDRNMPDKMFSFKFFAQLINDANFYRVRFCDPHSYVMDAAIQNSQVWYPFLPGNVVYDLFFYPDNGAAKKYSEIYSVPYRFGNKKRNLDTGEIIKYEVIADREDIFNKDILIRDDICMGGRTFKEAAKALKEMGAKRVDLYITHLMPQAENFYKNYKDYGIDNFYSENTLNMPWVEFK